ncbi:MAG: hypothetical protein GY778_07995 [bacterium]|nr:hypothetical protein [bacterium]
MSEQPTTNVLVIDPPRDIPRWFFVRRMQAMFFCALLFIGLGILLGVGLPVVFYFVGGRVSPMVDLSLDRRHADATAVVTCKELMEHMQFNSQHPWKVDFSFGAPPEITINATGFTYEPSIASLAVGDSIDVEYDPDDPTRARPVGGSASLVPLWLFGLLLLILGPELIGGVILLVAIVYLARGERTLLAYGVGAEATVLDVRPIRWIHFGSNSPYDVAYRFFDHIGREVDGRDRTYHYDWARQLEPGQTVGVVYNPHQPGANALWLHGPER